MAYRRYSPAMVSQLLTAVERRSPTESIATLCRKLAVSRATYYRWRQAASSTVSDRRLPTAAPLRTLSQEVRQRHFEHEVLCALARTLSAVERRQAAIWAQARFGASARMLKRVLGVGRRANIAPKPSEQMLLARMRELSRSYPDYGYRRIAVLLRREGILLNHKRAARLWSEIARSRRLTRPRLRAGRANQPSPLAAPWPHYCWSLDTTHYRTSNYRRLEFVTIIDDFSRYCLALEAARSVRSKTCTRVLKSLFGTVGPPRLLRVDRGAAALLRPLAPLLAQHRVTVCVTRGTSPAENAYIESFHATLAQSFFAIYSFHNVAHAQKLADDWRCYYNERRPHSSLDYQSPQEFLATADVLAQK